MSEKNQESYHYVDREFACAKALLKDIHPAVSIFGSARIAPDHRWFSQCESLAKMISDAGFAVISGGGPGLMEAANKGAKDGVSIGLNIQLVHEQHPNFYQTISIPFAHFFTRKATFVRYSSAFVVMPGGFGTLDELFEVITLMQTERIRRAPIILYGSDFWSGLVDWINDQLLGNGLISAEPQLIIVEDNPQKIVDMIIENTQNLQPVDSMQL